MTSEPITTTQQQLSTHNDKEIQQRQDTNHINEIFEDDKEIIITQKRESNKRQRSESKSDRISPLHKTRNIENLNNSPLESSIFKTPDSSKETVEFDLFKEAYLKCCHESINHCSDNTLLCKCNLRYYKCKCGWKVYDTHLPWYQCENCNSVIVKCPGCETLYTRTDTDTETSKIECKKCKVRFLLVYFK